MVKEKVEGIMDYIEYEGVFLKENNDDFYGKDLFSEINFSKYQGKKVRITIEEIE